MSCSKPTPIDSCFTTKYWNISVSEKDTNLFKYLNQPLFFENGNVYFDNKEIGKYLLSNDTIIISDTAYYDKWVIKNGIDSDAKTKIDFDKVYDRDSVYRVIYIYLIGKIIKADQDSLIIEKIEGYGIPFRFNKMYKFYNDTLLYDSKLNIDSIEFSSSLCFGSCPALAIKITKDLNYYYWGGRNSKPKGFFKGKITRHQFDYLENTVRISNINLQDSTNNLPSDAPLVDLLIYYNKTKSKHFIGYLPYFPPRIKNIGYKFFEIYENIQVDTTDSNLKFKVYRDMPENIPPPPPPLKPIIY